MTTAAVRAQLTKILDSEALRDAHRLKRFLEYIVVATLAHRPDCLKEYLLGIEVFEKSPSFDPRLDPIVRVQAGRLRAKLKEYYLTEGSEDLVLIHVPKGSYIPVFAHTEPQGVSMNSPAYALYLRGRSLLSTAGRRSVLDAVKCFESSIANDPAFLLSYVGLATSYTFLAADDMVAPNDVAGKALEAADRAYHSLLT
jgi:hypothetical protein